MLNVVCAVIQDQAGRVLAALRPPGKALAGQWEFPGGKIESGETAEAALGREIREELGCAIVVGAALTSVRHPSPHGLIVLWPFRATLAEGAVPVAHEHSELRWVTAGEAAALDWAEADRPIVAEVFAQTVRREDSATLRD